jgi:predicted glycosyltransferase
MLTDTEHANLANWLTYPFTDVIIAPSCFKGEIKPKKHVVYNGYEELAYLHPNYFKPDQGVLGDVGLSDDAKFIIIRFVAWEASHDIGDHGFTNKKKVVKVLEEYGRVFITSETKLPRELEKYRISIPPEKMHYLLYYANLFIGESAPMSTESAILGTPAIFVSTSRRGYTDELESEYDMLYTFSDPNNAQEKALEKAVELLEDEDTKKKWQKKREKLLNDKIDVTKFMTEFIENYPESFHNLQQSNV